MNNTFKITGIMLKNFGNVFVNKLDNLYRNLHKVSGHARQEAGIHILGQYFVIW